jgi:iron complex outermembrane receptor protein
MAMKRSHLSLITATVLLIGVPLPASAQQLEEVVVSAQRRTTDLQSTPVAVTSLDSVQMERRGITEGLDIARQVPNLIAYNNVTLGASNAYWLRGIGSTESLSTFDPPVITYQDEIVNPRQNANNNLLVEVERLEVLRGPQGTLFGRNTTGGAINIITKKPHDQLAGSAEVRFGEFSELMVRGMINIPVTDKIFAKFSAYNIEDDGWQTSVRTGEDYNSIDGFGARAAFRFEIADGVTWDISTDIFEQDHQNLASIVDRAVSPTNHSADDGPVWALGTPELNDVFFRNCKDGPDALAWVRNGCTANEVMGVNVYSNLEVDLDGPVLNIIAGYRELDHNFSSPLFGSLRDGFDLPLSNNGDHDMLQLEAKLSGVAMDDRLNYVTGVFFMDEENRSVFETALAFGPGAGVFPLDLNIMENTTENLAVYAQADYAVTDQWTVTGGLRFTNEEKVIPFYENTVQGFDLTDIQAAGISTSDTVKKFSYRFVASFQATDDIMLFGSATTGFKSGGWNGRASAANLMTHFNEEEALSFELGARTELFENRLRVNVTAFNVTYDDLQLPSLAFQPAPGQAPTFVNNNAGEQETTGLEIDWSAGVTDNLSLYGSLGIQNAKYNSITPEAQASGIFVNSEPQRAPGTTWLLGVEFVTELAGGEVFANADIQSTDDFWGNAQNDPVQLNPGWESVNAAVGYVSANEQWTVQLDCKNCTDERWLTGDFLGARFIADPMRWGISVRFNYE